MAVGPTHDRSLWRAGGWVLAGTVAVAGVACSGDEGGNGGDGAAGASASSSGGAAAGPGPGTGPDREGLGDPPSGDLSGSGGAPSTPGVIACGASVCDPLTSPLGERLVACCPSGAEPDTCGLDLAPLGALGVMASDACQARDQAGDVSSECPGSAPVDLMGTASIVLEGCCRPDGRCGLMMDRIAGVVAPQLGCVANEAFGGSLVGGRACTGESGGAGGAPSGGAGGAPSGGAPSGGAPSGGAPSADAGI